MATIREGFKKLREVTAAEAEAIAKKIKERGEDRINGYIQEKGGVVWSDRPIEDPKFLSEMDRSAVAVIHSHTRVQHCPWYMGLGEDGRSVSGSREWRESAHTVKGAILLDPETGVISSHSCPETPQVDFLTAGDLKFSKKVGIPIYLVMSDYGSSDCPAAEAVAAANKKRLVWDFFDPTYSTVGKAFLSSPLYRKSDRAGINVRGVSTLTELNKQIAAIFSELEERQYAAWERYKKIAARCTASVEQAKAEFELQEKRARFLAAKVAQGRAALPPGSGHQLYLAGAANPIPVGEWLGQRQKQSMEI